MSHKPRTVLAVIPARMESERLPGKPLRRICGQPMIAWVYRRARQAEELDRVLVATDSRQIFAYCRENEIAVMMTSSAHRSGTDRIVEVMSREPADIYVNIQGDEPMITPEHIQLLLQPFDAGPETQVSTLKVAIRSQEAADPNGVKVVTDSSGRALYFSRSAIPFDREGSGHVQYYKHLGIYAYTAAALHAFHRLPASPLERIEKLEQLRFLENSIPITVVETLADTVGVDTEEDLLKVEAYFRQTGTRMSE